VLPEPLATVAGQHGTLDDADVVCVQDELEPAQAHQRAAGVGRSPLTPVQELIRQGHEMNEVLGTLRAGDAILVEPQEHLHVPEVHLDLPPQTVQTDELLQRSIAQVADKVLRLGSLFSVQAAQDGHLVPSALEIDVSSGSGEGFEALPPGAGESGARAMKAYVLEQRLERTSVLEHGIVLACQDVVEGRCLECFDEFAGEEEAIGQNDDLVLTQPHRQLTDQLARQVDLCGGPPPPLLLAKTNGQATAIRELEHAADVDVVPGLPFLPPTDLEGVPEPLPQGTLVRAVDGEDDGAAAITSRAQGPADGVPRLPVQESFEFGRDFGTAQELPHGRRRWSVGDGLLYGGDGLIICGSEDAGDKSSDSVDCPPLGEVGGAPKEVSKASASAAQWLRHCDPPVLGRPFAVLDTHIIHGCQGPRRIVFDLSRVPSGTYGENKKVSLAPIA